MLTIDLSPSNKFHYNQISNHNFQFLLLDQNLKALHTPFMCKDYLQDMFWIEHTGENQEVFGLEWKQGMMDITVPFFYLALTGGAYELQPKIPFLLSFLNEFEDAQGFAHSEVHETENPKHIVVKFSREWTQNGPLLSAFTTLIRLAAAYEGQGALNYIKAVLSGEVKGYPMYMNPEVVRLDRNGKRLAALLKGKKVKHEWKETKNVMSAHSTGIMNFSEFPEVELK